MTGRRLGWVSAFYNEGIQNYEKNLKGCKKLAGNSGRQFYGPCDREYCGCGDERSFKLYFYSTFSGRFPVCDHWRRGIQLCPFSGDLYFSAGLYRIYLNISRREAYSFGDLLYFFSHQPDHVIVASFVLALINLVTSLPLAWFSFTSNMGNTTEEQMNWAVTYMLLTLLGSRWTCWQLCRSPWAITSCPIIRT